MSITGYPIKSSGTGGILEISGSKREITEGEMYSETYPPSPNAEVLAVANGTRKLTRLVFSQLLHDRLVCNHSVYQLWGGRINI